jgi:DNA-binding transcriptional MerR regulator
MNGFFSTATAARVTGASVRQVSYWASTRLLRPSGADATGRGSQRRYTFRDLVALKTIRTLRDHKCPLQQIRKAVRYLKSHYPDNPRSDTLSRLTLLTDGKSVYMLTDEREIMEVVTKQHVWSVALGKLILETEHQVQAMPSEWIQKIRLAQRDYHLLIVRDAETGTYTAQCRELPGAIEQGDTAEEAVANGKEAVRSALAFMAKRRVGRKRNVEAR